jgi:hypothetical protein
MMGTYGFLLESAPGTHAAPPAHLPDDFLNTGDPAKIVLDGVIKLLLFTRECVEHPSHAHQDAWARETIRRAAAAVYELKINHATDRLSTMVWILDLVTNTSAPEQPLDVKTSFAGALIHSLLGVEVDRGVLERAVQLWPRRMMAAAGRTEAARALTRALDCEPERTTRAERTSAEDAFWQAIRNRRHARQPSQQKQKAERKRN